MSLAKSPSSSRRKGKAVAFDPLVISEEVDRSDSERSTEEEAERDPDGECAPLIDPWYETSLTSQKFLANMYRRRQAVY